MLSEIDRVIERLYTDRSKSGPMHMALLTRRLRTCFDLRMPDPANMMDLRVHTSARSRIAAPQPFSDNFYKRLWASPGMPELLLFAEDLLTDYARALRAAFPLGKPDSLARVTLLPAGSAVSPPGLGCGVSHAHCTHAICTTCVCAFHVPRVA